MRDRDRERSLYPEDENTERLGRGAEPETEQDWRDRIEGEQLRFRERFDELQSDVKKVLVGVGNLSDTVEDALREFRSNAWAKLPAWVATAALVVLAGVVLYGACTGHG